MQYIFLLIAAIILMLIPDYTEELQHALKKRKCKEAPTSKSMCRDSDMEKKMKRNLWGPDSSVLKLEQELKMLPDISIIPEMREKLSYHIEWLETFMRDNYKGRDTRALPELIKKYDAILATVLTTFEIAKDNKLPVGDYPLKMTGELIDSFIEESGTFVAAILTWQEKERNRVKQSLEDQLADEVELLSKTKLVVNMEGEKKDDGE
ncbi:hypothetical protein HB999_14595 [Listeria booriae]|uniref:hypothetical protein n=1 Tax=Listeria booriae TaxID=1552123 RepID=UPI00164DAAA5|nr:hypothetical protein [Listeria booriae]MBC6164672.1 hypothetical protein [Listeria booriae]